MAKNSKKTAKPALTNLVSARKIEKRKANKAKKARWAVLKMSLAAFEGPLKEDVLTEMRAFKSYKYTNTGKKYGPAPCLGCETGCDASDAHSC